ncbi:MAG: DUF4129 domain-containing protein [Vicinamibacterales bacterium]
MRSDDLRVELRRRSEWEAFELGRVMLRCWWRPVFRAWLLTYGPVALLAIALSGSWPLLAPLALWWVKPFFDRILLFVYARCVFGASPTAGDVWRAIPGLVRHSGLLAGLTVGRLSPIRSLLLPVWQLEEQRGAAARERARLISRRPWLHAAWLTMACATAALILTVSFVLVCQALVPQGQEGAFSWRAWSTGDLGRPALVLMLLFTAIADSIVEPLYVACGFSLYLNRRSDLEAWDVEIGFRSLAARLSRREGAKAGLAAALLTVVAVALGGASPRAQAPSAAPDPSARGPREVIQDVLRDPVFGVERDVVEWRPKAQETPEAEAPFWMRRLSGAVDAAAGAIRWLVWPAGILVLAWIIRRVSAGRIGVTRPVREPLPDVVFGVDVRPASLPDDVAGQARALIERGEITAALGLLYRGALSALVHRRGLSVGAGDTEEDCVRRSTLVLGAAGQAFFGDLVGCWQLAAYAHRPPSGSHAASLCDGWRVHFDPAADPPVSDSRLSAPPSAGVDPKGGR